MNRLDVDLITVGDHCRTGIQHMLHRNVAEKILGTARRSVLSFYVPEDD